MITGQASNDLWGQYFCHVLQAYELTGESKSFWREGARETKENIDPHSFTEKCKESMVRTLLRSHCNEKDKKLVLGIKDSLEGENETIILKNVPEVGSGTDL